MRGGKPEVARAVAISAVAGGIVDPVGSYMAVQDSAAADAAANVRHGQGVAQATVNHS